MLFFKELLSLQKKGFTFVNCVRCQTVFINPRPTASLLSMYYQKAKSIKNWNDIIFRQTEGARRKNIFKPRAKLVTKLCKKYHSSNNILVDVGAGFGTFCVEIKKSNYFKRVIAIEPSPDLSKSCMEKGIETIAKTFEKSKISQVDVITCFETLEHLYNPRTFVKSCKKVLSKNGLLILTTPNIKGFDMEVLGKKSENIEGPNHLNYFHPASISYLLKTCGFKIKEITTPGKLDADIVRGYILKYPSNKLVCPFLKNILSDTNVKTRIQFQKYLVNSNLSSHMWIVAGKI